MWKERADQTDMEVCQDTAGECCDSLGGIKDRARVRDVQVA